MTSPDLNATLDQRGARYGTFAGHATISQHLKQVIDTYADDRGCTLAADQREALHMIAHKIARILNGDPNYHDSWLDIAGYAMLVSDRLTGLER